MDAICVRRAVEYVAARSAGAPISPACPVTLNFHPDAHFGQELMISVLARDGVYRSQFETGTSNGGLTAYPGGERWAWESRMFGGAYDDADPALRPKYGALNYLGREIGGSPRFGSCHLRLRPHVLSRTTFCYPDSHLDPQSFGVAARMRLVELANENTSKLEVLDDYVEAHVHGLVDVSRDVEAVVLDPCYRDTPIEEAAARLPCAVEWHAGFRMAADRFGDCAAYRGNDAAALVAALAVNGLLTPHIIGRARGSALDPQLLKRAWHCLARFGSPVAYEQQG
jgi:hypothetical protein